MSTGCLGGKQASRKGPEVHVCVFVFVCFGGWREWTQAGECSMVALCVVGGVCVWQWW